ncbi:hypothetical protein P5673_032571, partial [Acropora cervicornis]
NCISCQEQGVNVQPSFVSLEVTCSYSPQDLLSKCVPGTKCTKEQLYFRNLLRDCAKQSKIWDKAYPLPSIPDGKINKFFELIYTAAPQLKAHKNDVKERLGQALQNRRKYQNDLKMGKRKAKNGSKDVKVGCKKSITAFLESAASSSSACSQSREEVIVYKSVDMKVKLAKAISLGPHNDTDKADMYSLLQLCTKYIQEGEKEIPLPAATPDGDTTLNELQVNAVFSWKTKKLASGHIKSLNHQRTTKPPKKKFKKQKTLVTKSKDDTYEEETGDLAKTDPAPASFVKAHDGGSIGVGQWVAVAYDNKYYIGKVTAIERPVLDNEYEISINYLARGQNGKYKWPKKKRYRCSECKIYILH